MPQNENNTVDKYGRASKLFYDVSERSKIRKVKSLVDTTSPERLLREIRVSLFKEGKYVAVDSLKQSTEYSSHPGKIRRVFRGTFKSKIKHYR